MSLSSVSASTAVLVTALAAGYGMVLPVAGTLPARVPIAVVFAVLRYGRGRIAHLGGSDGSRKRSTRRPGGGDFSA
jgi:hypothetical protein